MKYPLIRRDKLNDDEFFLLKKESLADLHNDIVIREFIVRKISNYIYIAVNIGSSTKDVHVCNSYAEFKQAYLELKLEHIL